jgi:hypothetical protein
VGLTKIAILFLYLRLAVEKTFRFICWATVAFVMATIVSCVVAGVFQCNPIAFAWDKTIPGGTCFNVTALFYANAGLNILQDVFIYVLPMKMLWEVQIPRKQKIALIIVFVVGGFVCVTGMLRLDSLRTASISKDPTCKQTFLPTVFQKDEASHPPRSACHYRVSEVLTLSQGIILDPQFGPVSNRASESSVLR